MFYTDDPIMDAERYFNEQDARLEQLPRCSECDEPIQDDEAYYINGEWICQDCMSSYLKEVIADD